MRDWPSQFRCKNESDAREHLTDQPPEQKGYLLQRARRALLVDDHERFGIAAEGLHARDVEPYVHVRVEPARARHVTSNRQRTLHPLLGRVIAETLQRLEEGASSDAASEIGERRVGR